MADLGECARFVKDTATNVSSVSVPITAAVAAGQTIMLGVLTDPNSAMTGYTVTDSQGNTWTQRKFQVAGASANGNLGVFECQVTTALSTSDTLTVGNVSSLRSPARWLVLARAFDDISAGFDVAASATALSSSPDSGNTATAAQNAELVFAAIGYTGTPSFTPGSGFSVPAGGVAAATVTTSRALAIEWQYVNASGTRHADATLGSGQTWTDAAVAMKQVAATNYTASPADPVGVSDTAAGSADNVRTATDPAGATDTAVTALDAARTASDPVGVSDATALDLGRALADPVGVTDFAGAALDGIRAAADPVAVTDAATLLAGISRSPADPAGVTDAATVLIATVRTAADAVPVSDSAAIVAASARSLTEAIAVTDSVSVTVSTSGEQSIADPAGITDAATTTLDSARTAADPVAVSDTAALARTIPVNDPVTVTDSVTVVYTAGVTVADPLAMSDLVGAALAAQRQPADPVGVSDSFSVEVGRSLDDPVSVTDSVRLDLARTLTDPVGITDAVGLAVERLADDQISVTDTAVAVLNPPEPRDLTLTYLVGEDRWTATTGRDRWSAHADPDD